MASDKAYDTQARLDALITQAGPELANASISNITGGGPVVIHSKTIPASTLKAGVLWTMYAAGTLAATTAPTAGNLEVDWGPVGTPLSGTQLGNLALPAAALSWMAPASAMPWICKVKLFGLSATEIATAIELKWRLGGGVANSVDYHTITDIAGLTSNVDRDVCLAWGKTGGTGITFATYAAHIGRRG